MENVQTGKTYYLMQKKRGVRSVFQPMVISITINKGGSTHNHANTFGCGQSAATPIFSRMEI